MENEMTPERFAQVICQSVLAVTALVYVDLHS